MCRRVSTTISTLVIAAFILQIVYAQQNREGEELVLSIKDDQKTQYLNHNFETHVYNYGYEINPDGQFHHEIHGSDGVTYGCYGYIDPFGIPTATFYISDGWGYRVVHPRQTVEIFLHKHEQHQTDSQSHDHDNHDSHEHHEHHGIPTTWENLQFPRECGNFETISTHPMRPTSEPGGGTQSGNFPNYPGQSQTERPSQIPIGFPAQVMPPTSKPDGAFPQPIRPPNSNAPARPMYPFQGSESPQSFYPSQSGTLPQSGSPSQIETEISMQSGISPVQPEYPNQPNSGETSISGTNVQPFPQPSYPSFGSENPPRPVISTQTPPQLTQPSRPGKPMHTHSHKPSRPSHLKPGSPPQSVQSNYPNPSKPVTSVYPSQPGYPTLPQASTSRPPLQSAFPSSNKPPSSPPQQGYPTSSNHTGRPSRPHDKHPSRPGKHPSSKPGHTKPTKRPSHQGHHKPPRPDKPYHSKPHNPDPVSPPENQTPSYPFYPSLQPEHFAPLQPGAPSYPSNQVEYPSPSRPIMPISSQPGYPALPAPDNTPRPLSTHEYPISPPVSGTSYPSMVSSPFSSQTTHNSSQPSLSNGNAGDHTSSGNSNVLQPSDASPHQPLAPPSSQHGENQVHLPPSTVYPVLEQSTEIPSRPSLSGSPTSTQSTNGLSQPPISSGYPGLLQHGNAPNRPFTPPNSQHGVNSVRPPSPLIYPIPSQPTQIPSRPPPSSAGHPGSSQQGNINSQPFAPSNSQQSSPSRPSSSGYPTSSQHGSTSFQRPSAPHSQHNSSFMHPPSSSLYPAPVRPAGSPFKPSSGFPTLPQSTNGSLRPPSSSGYPSSSQHGSSSSPTINPSNSQHNSNPVRPPPSQYPTPLQPTGSPSRPPLFGKPQSTGGSYSPQLSSGYPVSFQQEGAFSQPVAPTNSQHGNSTVHPPPSSGYPMTLHPTGISSHPSHSTDGSSRPPISPGYPSSPEQSNEPFPPFIAPSPQSPSNIHPASIPCQPSSPAGYPGSWQSTVGSCPPASSSGYPASSPPAHSSSQSVSESSRPLSTSELPETQTGYPPPFRPEISQSQPALPSFNPSSSTQTSSETSSEYPSTTESSNIPNTINQNYPGISSSGYPSMEATNSGYIDPDNPNPPGYPFSQSSTTNTIGSTGSTATGIAGESQGPSGGTGGVGGSGSIGGIGLIQGIDGDGGAGPLSPDGPWPTGEPGPNGPWPGDPAYNAEKGTRIYVENSFAPDIPIGSGTSISTEPKYYQESVGYNEAVNNNEEKEYAHSKIQSTMKGRLYPAPFTLSENSPRRDGSQSRQVSSEKSQNNTSDKLQRAMMSHIMRSDDDQQDDIPKFDSGPITNQIHDEAKDMIDIKNTMYQNRKELEPENHNFPHRNSEYDENYEKKISNDRQKPDINLIPPHEYSQETTIEKEPMKLEQTSDRPTTMFVASGVQPPSSIQIKSIPLPVGPDPERCPCYIVESSNTTRPHPIPTTTTTTTTTPRPMFESAMNNLPLYGQLGFIPVIFVPYCPGDHTNSENTMQSFFPSATPIPYPCSICSNQQNSDASDSEYVNLSELSNIKAIKRVLGVTKLGSLNVPIINTNNGRMRRQKIT